MYYSYDKVLSYGATLNFLIGGRGIGKTYGAKKFCIDDFLKHGNQFIYLRRYSDELKESMIGFFNSLANLPEYKEHKFKVELHKNSCVLYCDKEIMGYGMTLSTASHYKSREFPNVKNMIFDEFIIDKGFVRYLPKDVFAFLDLCETVFRARKFRAFLLGNSISRTNPYFNFFKINQPYNSEIKTYNDGRILIQMIEGEEFKAMKRETDFGKIISGTAYGDYAIDNEWLHENNVFVGKRASDSKFWFVLKFGKEKYGVWRDFKNDRMYISKDYDPSYPIVATVNADDHDDGTMLMNARKGVFGTLLDAFKSGSLWFENSMIKEIIMNTLYKYLT